MADPSLAHLPQKQTTESKPQQPEAPIPMDPSAQASASDDIAPEEEDEFLADDDEEPLDPNITPPIFSLFDD